MLHRSSQDFAITIHHLNALGIRYAVETVIGLGSSPILSFAAVEILADHKVGIQNFVEQHAAVVKQLDSSASETTQSCVSRFFQAVRRHSTKEGKDFARSVMADTTSACSVSRCVATLVMQRCVKAVLDFGVTLLTLVSLQTASKALGVLNHESRGGGPTAFCATFLQLYDFHQLSQRYWVSRSGLVPRVILRVMVPALCSLETHELFARQAAMSPGDLARWQLVKVLPAALIVTYRIIYATSMRKEKNAWAAAEVSPSSLVEEFPKHQFFRRTVRRAIALEYAAVAVSVGVTYALARFGPSSFLGPLLRKLLWKPFFGPGRGEAYLWTLLPVENLVFAVLSIAVAS